jgi:hypothetical protein
LVQQDQKALQEIQDPKVSRVSKEIQENLE